MKSKTIFLVVVVLFLCACPAFGLLLKGGLTYNIDYEINDHIWVDYDAPGMYTTLNLLDGASTSSPYRIFGCENSRINVLGGSIFFLLGDDYSHIDVSGGSIDDLNCFDSSQVDITGAITESVYCNSSSYVRISNGSISKLSCHDSSQADISGGYISSIFTNDTSQINISGGEIYGLCSSHSSQVNFSGGSIEAILSYHDGQVNISGGSICGEFSLYHQSEIFIYGCDFAVDGQPFGYGELTSIFGGSYYDEPFRHLTGTLLNGGFIDTDFQIGHDARIVLIPEPASAMILGLSSFFFALRRRRR